VLAALVARIGETCNFTTFDRAQVLDLDRVEAAWPLRLTLDVGSHVPLHWARMTLRRALAQLEPMRDAAKKMERLL
jgi:DNA-binding IclR family transcriptional regulator